MFLRRFCGTIKPAPRPATSQRPEPFCGKRAQALVSFGGMNCYGEFMHVDSEVDSSAVPPPEEEQRFTSILAPATMGDGRDGRDVYATGAAVTARSSAALVVLVSRHLCLGMGGALNSVGGAVGSLLTGPVAIGRRNFAHQEVDHFELLTAN
ncbi:hypothetical protein C8J57DRAFT_1472047 [Mycena rebaudengoi]|nr:hypothetical protein C8J57DRAFT_1472047 [Mycena rebaudengoi]